MRATPDVVLEITTSVPDLALRVEIPIVAESYTPDQMQRTIPCDDEIHAFDFVMDTEAQAGELHCAGPYGWSFSAGGGEPAYVARAERQTHQQKASDTKRT